MIERNSFHLHLVSDSTGETLSSISRSVMVQFEGVEPIEHIWTLVRTKGQMERVIRGIEDHPGIVMYTVMNEQLHDQLKLACNEMKIPCMPVLDRIVQQLSSHLGIEPSHKVGRQYAMDEDYFARIEAVHFAVAHDDGQNTDNLEEADVVLVGVSRTSKTPTCVYLSYRGVRAANVPYVKGCPLPDNLPFLKQPLVIGLVIDPERLIQIRRTRLAGIQEQQETNYIDMEEVKEEIREARMLFSKHKWPVIDVTRRSIEETTAQVMQLVERRREAKG